MNTLSTLKAPHNSRHRKKRVGRGQGSGLGKTAGRGGKGQKARSGNMHFEGFEGGQSPLHRRLPKFGFTPPNRLEFAIVNLSQLDRLDNGVTVDEELLRDRLMVRGRCDGIKVLGTGKLSKKLTVKVHRFSTTAKQAIEAAGGTAQVLPMMDHKPESDPKVRKAKKKTQASA